jgi:hypothetical protein
MIYGFDFDGTLVETWTDRPLPGAKERLAALGSAHAFIATNQAGPVWRAMTGETKYPTVEDVASRIVGGLKALEWKPELLLICVHPGKVEGDAERWQDATEDAAIALKEALLPQIGPMFWAIYSQVRYRKPEPGMLHDAYGFLTRYPYDHDAPMLFIGDRPEDAGAAQAAHCRYQDAVEWRST